MTKNCLHITNGNALTDYLRELDFSEDILTWQEMLCEGPTIRKVYTNEFSELRKSFFSTFYDVDLDLSEINL